MNCGLRGTTCWCWCCWWSAAAVAWGEPGSTTVGNPAVLTVGEASFADAATSLSMRALSMPRLTRRRWRVSAERPSNDDGGDSGRAVSPPERAEPNDARRRSSLWSTMRGDARTVKGNAPHDVKQLTLNTLGAYGVGAEDSFAHAAGRQIRITAMDVFRRGCCAELGGEEVEGKGKGKEKEKLEVVAVAEAQVCKGA